MNIHTTDLPFQKNTSQKSSRNKVPEKESVLNESISKKISQILFNQRENNSPTLTWHMEQQLMSLIRNGNIRAVEQKIFDPQYTQHAVTPIGFYSDDPYRTALYSLVSAIVLFTRAAISGGLPDDIAYAICRAYIQTADTAANPEELDALYFDAVRRYTLLVHEYRQQFAAGSSKVDQIKAYISSNLHERLSIQDIASAVYLSVPYCCKIFKEETGLTINDYINAERLESACNLLKYSDFSIQQISSYLGFSTQSYFTKLFRKKYKITPLQFRKQNKPDEFII